MKRFIAFILVFMMAFPVAAESIDLSRLSYSELVDLRERIDDQLAYLDMIGEQIDEPDYSAMPLEDAVASIGENSNDGVCYFRNCESDDEALYVHVNLKKTYDEWCTISDTIEYSIAYSVRAFSRDDVEMIRFFFHEAGYSTTGEKLDMITITMKIKKETFEKMDVAYFYEYAPNNQLLFLNSIDAYTLHKDYKKVVR